MKEFLDKPNTVLWAVTGTFHGAIIESETEGKARRIFHKHYNGESIIHIKKTKQQ